MKIDEDKFELIDDFLTSCEDWMHGEQGKSCTQARVYLNDIKSQIEKEVQARVDFKIREILTAVKNKSKFNYNIAFNEMSQKHSHYNEAFSEFEHLVMKEISLPIPYDEMYELKLRNIRDKSIDKLEKLFDLRGQRDYQHKIQQIVNIIEETQNI
jgi:hypothetical protein